MRFIKYDGRELKERMTIRLAGREGRIEVTTTLPSTGVSVSWNDGDGDFLTLTRFPDLEIGIEEPTISREACNEIVNWIEKNKIFHPSFSREEYVLSPASIEDKLESMIEKPEHPFGCVTG